ncbi:MAG: PEGA domain-containing protein, partial [Gammaproteobacteria bacterium]
LVAGACQVTFAIGAAGLSVTVGMSDEARSTLPPVIEPGSTAGVVMEAPREETIKPLDYQPAQNLGKPGKRGFPIVGTVLFAALCILGLASWFMFTARSVEVLVTPEPESLSVGGGVVVSFGPRYLMRPGRYRVEAGLAAYEPLSEEVEVTDERAQTIQLTMTRLADRLHVETGEVTGAQVSLDGEPAGETPLADYAVRPGRYRLEISAERFVTYAEELDVEGGGAQIHRQVELVPDWAAVMIASRPEGATVLADGQEIGVTPIKFELRSGRHELEVRKPGFKTWRQPVTVEPATPMEIPEIVMRPSDGRLVVKSEPPGATVLVDGQFRGQSPLRLDLDPGRQYQIEVSQAGHEALSRPVKLSSGQTRTENFRLRAVIGVIELAVSPAGVNLAIDGKAAGPAPNRIELISTPHRLEFTKPGYVSQTINVKPTPGMPQRMQIKLLTKEEAALAAIPKSITTAQGAELVLVPSGRFTMGAPRGEPGRRANEGLREVKISNPYYIGVREVTNRDFREYRRAHSSGTAVGYGLDGDDYPVVRVNWQDAAAYCNWLSQQDSLPPAYRTEDGRLVAIWPPTTGYRLPTEAEWVWAARYSGSNAGPPRYPWGDSMPPTPGSGNYADVSARAGLQQVLTSYNDDYPVTAQVGRFRPTRLGLLDVGGNVSEWTNDLYRAYTGANAPLAVDPNGAEEGRYYVIRGSSWRHGSISELRMTWRDSADEARPDLGFRITRSIN